MISMDQQLIEESVRNIFKAIGEQPNRPGLQETPQRVAKMYEEIFSSLDKPEFEAYKIFDTDHTNDGELVTVTEIPF
ncbi:GTP cyclohydrolase I, partial [Staphylococcus aureus]|nr:GTP cyclohydrolase I [Staphylococcus aureus]